MVSYDHFCDHNISIVAIRRTRSSIVTQSRANIGRPRKILKVFFGRPKNHHNSDHPNIVGSSCDNGIRPIAEYRTVRVIASTINAILKLQILNIVHERDIIVVGKITIQVHHQYWMCRCSRTNCIVCIINVKSHYLTFRAADYRRDI